MSTSAYSHSREKPHRIPLSLLQSIGFEGDILDKFRNINDRRFHNTTSKYTLPNDEIEIDRLELCHLLLKSAFRSNFSSPVQDKLSEGISVLDVGCGTGNWIIENATDYPKSTFVGIDISPIFPTENKPQNAGFIECNILDGLPFPPNTFDFVHQRLLYAAFSEKQWLQVIKEIIRVLKPSGYVEFMEADAKIFDGPTAKEFKETVLQFYQSEDMCLNVVTKLKEYMECTEGCGEVKTDRRLLPIGKWGGNFGELMLEYMMMAVKANSILMSKKLNYTEQECENLADTLCKEINDHKSNAIYIRFYAQKI